MPIRIPSHLYRNRHGTFYFRFSLPLDLRSHVKQSGFRYSLNTEERHQAIITAIPLIAGLPGLVADLRRMANDNTETPSDYFKLWIAEKLKSSRLVTRNEELENELIDARRELRNSVPREKAKGVVKQAHKYGQLKGKHELEEQLVFPWPADRTVKFSELKISYLKSLTHNRASGGSKRPPTAKTLEDYDKNIGFFVTVMGDMHIGASDKEIAGEYFAILRRLPANMNKIAIYRNKSVPELIAMQPPPVPQSESNCSKKIERISTMFAWSLDRQ